MYFSLAQWLYYVGDKAYSETTALALTVTELRLASSECRERLPGDADAR